MNSKCDCGGELIYDHEEEDGNHNICNKCGFEEVN